MALLGRIALRCGSFCPQTLSTIRANPLRTACDRNVSTCRCSMAATAHKDISDDDCVHALKTTGERVPHVNCWRCDKRGLDCVNERFFCEQCGALQPPVKCVNYFQYLDTDVAYSLNTGSLKDKYRKIVGMLHPDKFASSSHVEMDYSERQASVVNRAYKTVSKPVERAMYLLQLHGVPFDDDTVNTVMDPMFLIEMLELNEEVEDATNDDKLHQVKSNCLAEQAECEKQLTSAFERQDFAAATKIIARMKYFARVIDNVERKLGF